MSDEQAKIEQEKIESENPTFRTVERCGKKVVRITMPLEAFANDREEGIPRFLGYWEVLRRQTERLLTDEMQRRASRAGILAPAGTTSKRIN